MAAKPPKAITISQRKTAKKEREMYCAPMARTRKTMLKIETRVIADFVDTSGVAAISAFYVICSAVRVPGAFHITVKFKGLGGVVALIGVGLCSRIRVERVIRERREGRSAG